MTAHTDRTQKLRQMLEKSPGDPFLLYAMGMEHKKAGDAKAAIEFFDQTVQHDPGYCYAYFQKGQVLELSGDVAGAKQAYHQGIDAAVRKGDTHAQQEIAGALAMIE